MDAAVAYVSQISIAEDGHGAVRQEYDLHGLYSMNKMRITQQIVPLSRGD